MPTIIDSLIVKLGLDSKDLDSKATTGTKKLKDLEGQSAKTEKGVKSIGDTSKKSAAGVETLTRALGSFLALIGGTAVLKAFVEDTIASNAQLERFSKNLGLSVTDVSAWGNAVEEMGGSAKGLHSTFDLLSKGQTEFALTGQSSLIPYLSSLGVAFGTVGKNARPVDQILLDLADRFSGMDRTTANNFGRMMGIDQDTMNLLLQGRREVELTLKRQKEYTAVTKAQAEESVKLQRSMIDLRQSFAAFGRDLLQQASPAIEKFLGVLKDFGSWVSANKEFVVDFLTVMAVGLGAIALATLPITGTVAAVTALGAAIALLWQDYQTWKRGGDSFVDWQVWKDRVDAVTDSIKKLRSALESIEDKTNKALRKSDTYRKFDDWFTNKGDAKKLGDSTGSAVKSLLGIRQGGSISDQAKAQAARVSKMTGIPADILWAQWAHETGNFTNPGTTQLNNLAGVNVPGGKGQDYRKFGSLDEFGDYYAHLMRPDGFYPGASTAKTPEDFAAALKHGKYAYYSGPEDAYAKDMRRYVDGIKGASVGVAAAGSSQSSSSSTTDKSVSVQTGDIVIHTQATDANGIARDMGKSMDYLFSSHANAGLF